MFLLYSVRITGIMKNHAVFAPFNHSNAVHYYTQTEMRHNYRPPQSKLELLWNNSRYGCNKLHGIAARGIGKLGSITVPIHSDYYAILYIRHYRVKMLCKGVNISHQWTLPYFSISYVINRFGSFFMPKICPIKVL